MNVDGAVGSPNATYANSRAVASAVVQFNVNESYAVAEIAASETIEPLKSVRNTHFVLLIRRFDVMFVFPSRSHNADARLSVPSHAPITMCASFCGDADVANMLPQNNAPAGVKPKDDVCFVDADVGCVSFPSFTHDDVVNFNAR